MVGTKQHDSSKAGKGSSGKAKTTGETTKAAAPQAKGEEHGKKRAVRDEIDDIFKTAKASKKQAAGGDAAAAGSASAAGAAAAAVTAAAKPAAKAKQPSSSNGGGGGGNAAAEDLAALAAEVRAARAKQAPRPKVEGSKDDIFGDGAGAARKRTEEGYAVYTADELGLGRRGGGDTDLCPFDCECCY
jgi:Tfp pilus assembly protein FimV